MADPCSQESKAVCIFSMSPSGAENAWRCSERSEFSALDQRCNGLFARRLLDDRVSWSRLSNLRAAAARSCVKVGWLMSIRSELLKTNQSPRGGGLNMLQCHPACGRPLDREHVGKKDKIVCLGRASGRGNAGKRLGARAAQRSIVLAQVLKSTPGTQ